MLLKYMALVTTLVEIAIAELFSEYFALVFDGWSCDDTHYVAKFATFTEEEK